MNSELDLEMIRVIDAPLALVWKAWTDPDLLKQWWTPRPWTTAAVSMDLRAGGAFKTTMRSPEGQEMPHEGVFLDVVAHQRIAFTDAVNADYRPSAEPFMTAIITFEDAGSKTKYNVQILHPNTATRKKHEEMGFEQGWSTAISQLEEVAKSLA